MLVDDRPVERGAIFKESDEEKAGGESDPVAAVEPVAPTRLQAPTPLRRIRQRGKPR